MPRRERSVSPDISPLREGLARVVPYRGGTMVKGRCYVIYFYSSYFFIATIG